MFYMLTHIMFILVIYRWITSLFCIHTIYLYILTIYDDNLCIIKIEMHSSLINFASMTHHMTTSHDRIT